MLTLYRVNLYKPDFMRNAPRLHYLIDKFSAKRYNGYMTIMFRLPKYTIKGKR